MSITRIYQPISLAVHTTVGLDEKSSHHVARVLRARVGDTLTLFNGKGGEYTGVIKQIDKRQVTVEINDFSAREVESPLNLYLAQGIARGEKMDFIVQKAVELGVKKIIPLITERCNVRLDNEREEKRLQHWQAVAMSACEQSGRNRIPEILAPQTFAAWLPLVQAEQCYVLSPHRQEKLPSQLSATSTVVLLIGPEGGLSDSEVALAMQHQFLPLNLGPRVLRTETATIAALSVLQFHVGDFS
jgi:16S rRNA (uracil1498-N3)-methyltransferase